MNRIEIEQAVLNEMHSLPLDKVEETLNFVLSLKKQPVKKRPLGPLNDKVDSSIDGSNQTTEGEKVLAILQKTGYLASMPDVADLSENYKDYLDWSDKV